MSWAATGAVVPEPAASPAVLVLPSLPQPSVLTILDQSATPPSASPPLALSPPVKKARVDIARKTRRTMLLPPATLPSPPAASAPTMFPNKDRKTRKTTSKSAVSCYECGIKEKSKADVKLAQDWIKCCYPGCDVWSHEACGGKNGILTDKQFFCAQSHIIY